MIPCLILGGGRGTRMRPLTDTVPKPLLPVCGVPFAVRQVEWLHSQGVYDIVYSVGYLADQFRDVLGLSVTYVAEAYPLGTGGAVRHAVEQVDLKGPFFVLYGDSYLDIDLTDVLDTFDRSCADGLMTVYQQFGSGNATFKGRSVTRYDKEVCVQNFVDYGLLVLTAESVLERLPAGRSDLSELIGPLSRDGFLAGYEAQSRFYEIGSPEGFAELVAVLGD